MRVSATVCSKGGVGKTTATANLGGLPTDAGLRVLLMDLDSRPTLSSYYELSQPAPGGVHELLATELVDLDRIPSRTAVSNLLIVCNDYRTQLLIDLSRRNGPQHAVGDQRGPWTTPVGFLRPRSSRVPAGSDLIDYLQLLEEPGVRTATERATPSESPRPAIMGSGKLAPLVIDSYRWRADHLIVECHLCPHWNCPRARRDALFG